MDRRRISLVKSIFLCFLFIVVLVRTTYKGRVLNKYIKTSTKDKKIDFKVLIIQRK